MTTFIVTFITAVLTVLAFVVKNALLHMICVAWWLLLGFCLWNSTWPAGNTFLSYAAILICLGMVIVNLVTTLNHYLGLRTAPPTHDSVQADYRRKVLDITRRKEPREW